MGIPERNIIESRLAKIIWSRTGNRGLRTFLVEALPGNNDGNWECIQFILCDRCVFWLFIAHTEDFFYCCFAREYFEKAVFYNRGHTPRHR